MYGAGRRQAQPQVASQTLARGDGWLKSSGVAAGSTPVRRADVRLFVNIRLLHNANASALQT
jgi:hypothetical protein